MGWSHTHMWWIKIWEGHLKSEGPHPHTRPASLGFQCHEDKSPLLVVVKTSGDWGCGRQTAKSLRQFLLKGMHTDLLGLTPSELCHSDSQCRGSRLKGIRNIQGGTEPSRIRVRAVCGSILPDKSTGRGYCSWNHRTTELVGGCHIWDSISLAQFAPPWWFPEALPLPIFGPTQTVPANGLAWPMLHMFLNSLNQTASGLSVPCACC